MLATALSINKSFMRTFSVHIKEFTNRFNWQTITAKIRNKITSKIINDRIPCIAGTEFELLEQKDLVAVNVLTSWLTLLVLRTLCLDILLEQAGLITVDGLACWLVLVKIVRIRRYSGLHFSHIFLHSCWIRRDTGYLSIFSTNAGKCGKNAD